MWKDCETNIDLLDFDYLVDVTKKIILNDDLTPSTIGIYGDWGSGKSSLMDMAMADLAKEEGVICLKFNGWLFEGYEDAKSALIGSILDKISEDRKLIPKTRRILRRLYDNIDFFKLSSKAIKYGLDFFLTGGVLTATDITAEAISKALSFKGSQLEEKEIEKILKTLKGKDIRKNIKSFHKDFADLLEESKIKRLVVFIDELDRCNHDTILDTLEAIRLFLFAKGTSFIIGADERQIQYAVQMKYPDVEGNQIDIGKEYLEKLIQYPIRIPQLGRREVEFYIMCLLFEKDFKNEMPAIYSIIKEGKEDNFLDFELTYELIKEKDESKNESEGLADKLKDVISLSKQISSVLTKGLNGNPRHCKRFLNAMELRIQMSDYRKIKLDRRILSKIMLVEYFRDTFYKRLAELQPNEKGILEEIEFIESNKWDDAKELGIWRDDAWVVEWINIEPNLAKEDLKPYFYFSRESLRYGSFTKQQSLSNEATKIVERLLSEGDSARIEAIKCALNITEYEAAAIHKILVSKIESATDIDKPLFQSFIEWSGVRTELQVETIAVLERISAKKIRAPFIPLITAFAQKLSSKAKIVELYNKWISENTKIKGAIENELPNLI